MTNQTRVRLEKLATQLTSGAATPPVQLQQLAKTLGVEGGEISATTLARRARFLATTGFDALKGAPAAQLEALDAALSSAIGKLQENRSASMLWKAQELSGADPSAPMREVQVHGAGQTVAIKVPLTPVYAHNLKAFDAFFGVTQPLPLTEQVSMADVPQRYGAVVETFERIRAKSTTPVQREVIGREQHLGRSYELVAYQIGSSHPAPGKVGLVLTAGVHGDETGAVMGLAETFQKLLERKDLLEHFEPIVIVPAANPVSLDLGVREDLHGRDPNRQFWTPEARPVAAVLALEGLVQKVAKPELPFIFIDLHQDDRYDVREGYALFGNEESQALAAVGIGGLKPAGYRPVLSDIDGVENRAGVLPKKYPHTYTPNPERSAKNTRALVVEINDPGGFWPAVESVLAAPEAQTLGQK